MRIRKSFLPFALAGVFVLGLLSCEFSRPPAATSSKGGPQFLLKFSAYSQNEAVKGYFTLGNAATNQIAAAGRLKIQVYTSTHLNVGGESAGLSVKSRLYDNTIAVGATNFHWETFGSMFTVQDLAFRFAVPYAHFKIPVRKGRVATIQIEFHPEDGSNTLSAVRKITLY